MPPAPLHPDLEPLAFLLGTWQGEGDGGYPTSASFRYRETVRIWHVGDAFLLYAQDSFSPEGEPLHFETGFWRTGGPGRVELVLAHPLGLVEVAEGTVDGSSVELSSSTVGRTATGPPVVAIARRMRLEDGALVHELDMASGAVPMTAHLHGRLVRAGG